MELTEKAVLLRVFIGESDKLGHLPLYEAIVKRARDEGLAVRGLPFRGGQNPFALRDGR